MKTVLTKDFFDRFGVEVARSLLGKYLVRRYRGKEMAYRIVDVEVYEGFEDKASHAHRGETPRNKVMFGPAGYWYVYFVYGMHWMLNIVTSEKGHPAAILIRGVEGITGPARLTKTMHITSVLNGKRAVGVSGLWIEDRGDVIDESQIVASPRIGVDYAGEEWAKKPWRFVLVSNKK